MSVSDLNTGVATPRLACVELPEDGATLYVGNELHLQGWAATAGAPAAVAVSVGAEEMPVTDALESPSTADAIPGFDGSQRAGFEVRVDTSGWQRGQRPIRIVARDDAGSETAREGVLEVLPYRPAAPVMEEIVADVAAGRPAMSCDEPPLDGSFEAGQLLALRGWAFAKGGLEGVFISLDGRRRSPATFGLHRRDLVQLVDRAAGRAGWELILDLHEVPEGEHRLTVVAVDHEGQAVGVEGPIHVKPGASRRSVSRRIGDAAERFVPEECRGQLIDAEHQARYRWAAGVARGADVLDAGCGEGYGASILAEAGARRVVGIDREPEAVLNARERAGEVGEFVLGDLRTLPFEDASFDLVTCFEAIEHVVDADAVLDELRRVLREDGVLLVSTPNREMFTPGNPYHVHEYAPAELELALGSRFANVRLHRQNAHLASFLAGDEASAAEDGATPLAAEARKLAAARAELYTVAAASDAQLPAMGDVLMLGGIFEVRLLFESAWEWEERAIAAEADAEASRGELKNAVLARERAERLLDEVQAELHKLTASKSWRMTALPRRAADAVRRRLRPPRSDRRLRPPRSDRRLRP